MCTKSVLEDCNLHNLLSTLQKSLWSNDSAFSVRLCSTRSACKSLSFEVKVSSNYDFLGKSWPSQDHYVGCSEADLPLGKQSLKLLVHVKQTGEKGNSVLGMAEKSELQVCHALPVACHCLKQD